MEDIFTVSVSQLVNYLWLVSTVCLWQVALSNNDEIVQYYVFNNDTFLSIHLDQSENVDVRLQNVFRYLQFNSSQCQFYPNMLTYSTYYFISISFFFITSSIYSIYHFSSSQNIYTHIRFISKLYLCFNQYLRLYNSSLHISIFKFTIQ